MNKSTTTFAGLARFLGVPASLAEVNPIQTLTGYAVYPYPVKLQDDQVVTEFLWQLGGRAPDSGEKDMVLLPLELGVGKSFDPIAKIPGSVVAAADIRVGDIVTVTCTGKTPIQISGNGGRVELPTADDFLSTVSANGFLRGILPQGWHLLVNGAPPRPRPHWLWSQPPEDSYFPHDRWELGTDPADQSVQMVELAAGRTGRGVRALWLGESGSGKTRAILSMCKNMARYNRGRPIKFVVGLLGESKERIGLFLRELKSAIYNQDGTLIPEVSGLHTFLCDADYQTAPFLLLMIAQLCLGFAQRMAEECILLPEEERYSIVVIFDSLSRIFHAMKFSGEGKGMTESGGEDPWASVLAGLLQLTARTGYWTHPETGESVWVDVTSFFTLLDDASRAAQARRDSQEGVVNAFLFLQGRKTRDPRARIWPTISVGDTLIREWEDLCETWEVEARNRLAEKLFWSGGSRTQVDKDATVTLEDLIREHGTAEVALKSMVPDLCLGPETERARELVRAGAVPGDELNCLDQLVLMLVIPKDWGPKIWKQLADEGLVEPLDYLKARQLAIEGRLETPKDLHGLPGVDSFRATGLWERFATEGLVPPLEQLLQRVLRSEEIESADDLVTALGITRTRAQELWGGVLWVEEPKPAEEVVIRAERPDDGLLTRTRELINDGHLFPTAETLALALGVRFDEAEDVLALLTIDDYITMSTSARDQLHQITSEKGCGLIDAVKTHFGLPFGMAKDVVEGIKAKPANKNKGE